MDDKDMIVNKDGNMTCDGYTVNSNFFNNEIPISCRINSDDLFGGKSLPAGLLFLNTESTPPPEDIQMGGLIDSSVFDKFIDKFGGDGDAIETSEQEEKEEKEETQENHEKQEDKENANTKTQTRKTKRNKTHNKRPIIIKTRVKRKNTLRKRLKFIP